MSENKKPQICVVEDDDDLREATVQVLKASFEVCDFNNPQDALAAIETWKHSEVILCDLHLPKMNGLAFVELLKQNNLPANVVLLSGYADKAAAIKAVDLGVFKILEKPFRMENLLEVLLKASQANRALAEVAIHQSKMSTLHQNLGEVLAERLNLAENSAEKQNVDLYNQSQTRLPYTRSLRQERLLREQILSQKEAPLVLKDVRSVPRLKKG